MENRHSIYTWIGTAALLMVLAGSACTKLDPETFSELVEESIIYKESDTSNIIAQAYSPLRPVWADWMGNFDLQEESADEIITPARPNGWYDGGTYQRMHRHTWTSLQEQPDALWGRVFNGVANTNRAIYLFSSGKLPVGAAKESLVAELKALRAFYYWLLCDNFGNVPIVTDYEDLSVPKQSQRKEVYDFIVKELNDNIPLLRESAGTGMYGRFNKWAAKTLLAKMYLNAGVYSGATAWPQCLQQCNDVIQAAGTGLYMLEPQYRDNFKTNNETSRELIFTVPYDEINAPGFIIHMKTLDPLSQQVFRMEAQPWGGNCAVPQFINTYDPEDTRLKDTWLQGPQKTPAGVEVIDYVNFVGGIEKSKSNEGFRVGKYEIRVGAKGSLSNDFPIFRYADVLMMKAECLLRTGQTGEAAQLVTQVRQRAFATTTPAKATVTAADLQKGSKYQYGYWDNGQITELQGGDDVQLGRLLDELGWEFAAEAHRRQDLIRFGIFATKKWFQHRPNGANRTIFLIPQEELNKNPNLVQNPL
ncbi:RagB/SusD family nutrient uptake outer membrane protein [Chitinophaga agrisoli]|uniref:RagB/SusD family nutrient uptake outer membrane protein n=1 Tax=Chitinophaga agrisoli TaxID=2607653 RepID=A0A5B2W1D0_9BACT|nr:RagB/SusD family nutrient uptake outer membrane protein [Chitinophaga agrisoli]KAA2244580.1 RagB/SusD family nutrient uptake outer membrane protein [Chitinophaga agrisoli]